MTDMSVNWGELMAGGAADFQPVPKGNYDVFIETAEPTQSTTGKLMFKIRFKIETGPQASRTVFYNNTLTQDNPNALRMFFLNMKNMGLSQDFFAQNPSPSQIAGALIGNRCRIEVDHRPYQGQMRENIKSVLPAAGVSAGGAMVASGPQIPQPGQTAGPVPSMPQPTASPLPQPVAPVAPATPAIPTPAAAVATPASPVATPPAVSPAPQVEAPVSTAVIPEPQNPAPPAEEAPPAAPAPVESELPPGFTDKAQYEQFLAFQRSQAAAAAPAPVAVETAPAGGVPVPPPIPF